MLGTAIDAISFPKLALPNRSSRVIPTPHATVFYTIIINPMSRTVGFPLFMNFFGFSLSFFHIRGTMGVNLVAQNEGVMPT
jgi:hypothetical protein